MKLKLVAFDNSILLVALRKGPIAASVDKAKERVDYLVLELGRAGERILIPTPALSETLVHAEKAASVYLEELQKSSRFQIAPFDTKAAVEVAADISASIKKGDKKGGAAGSWAKANFDRQIAAIAKSSGAHTVYTDDEDVEKHAKRMGLQVKRLSDLPLPESKTPLLDLIDEQEKKADAKGEESKPAPAQVSGSSERPAQSKAAGQEQAEQPKAEAQKAAVVPPEDALDKEPPIRMVRFDDEEENGTISEMPKPADKGGPDKGSS